MSGALFVSIRPRAGGRAEREPARTRDERGRSGHLRSPSGCRVQCDAAYRPAVALPGADTPLTKTDQWFDKLEAALTATRRDDAEHGTNAAYVRGCACSECREHQRVRMSRNRG